MYKGLVMHTTRGNKETLLSYVNMVVEKVHASEIILHERLKLKRFLKSLKIF